MFFTWIRFAVLDVYRSLAFYFLFMAYLIVNKEKEIKIEAEMMKRKYADQVRIVTKF